MEFTFHRATESDRTYLRRLNFLADIYGDESKEVRPEQLPDVERYVDEWDPQRDGGGHRLRPIPHSRRRSVVAVLDVA